MQNRMGEIIEQLALDKTTKAWRNPDRCAKPDENKL